MAVQAELTNKTMNRILTLCIIFATALSAFAKPERDKGLSLHMLPDRIAKMDNEKGGFTVSSPAPRKEMPAMDAKQILEYFQHLPASVKENGIWIVYTHPSSYSDPEKEQLKKLVDKSREKGIPIFTCRAMELKKKNWKAGGLIE